MKGRSLAKDKKARYSEPREPSYDARNLHRGVNKSCRQRKSMDQDAEGIVIDQALP